MSGFAFAVTFLFVFVAFGFGEGTLDVWIAAQRLARLHSATAWSILFAP